MLAWFDRHRRDLPWRRTTDPYAIWVSEVMLQQTQVATATPYWERFLARFPTVQALAAAPQADVLASWRGLGYYARARNLHRAAQAVAAEHGGRLPSTAAELRALPGFGRYTAGAVASIAFGEPAAVLDGNVARVFSRLFVVEGPPGDRARETALWALADHWVQGERPGDHNQALMELGALVCRPESPTCLLCPVRAHCGALTQGRVSELPPPKVRPPRKQLTFLVAAFRDPQGRVLLARRHGRGLFGGLWELPCVEQSAPEVTAEAALVRAFGDQPARPVGTVRRTLTHRELALHVFQLGGAAPSSLEGYEELRWVAEDQLEPLGISAAMARALEVALAGGGASAQPRRSTG